MQRHTAGLGHGFILAVSTLTLLLLSGCALSKLPAVPPTNQQPAVPPSPVATPTALPARLARLYLSLSPWPLHGPPPFMADFSARLYGGLSQAATCRAVRWHFGDGTEEAQPCLLEEGLGRLQARHTYTQSGTYHARLTLTLADGREVESTTQTVVVAVPQPVPWSERMVRWGVWGLSLLCAAGALTWLRRRSGRRKTIGYALVGLGLITFVPPFSYLPDPAGLYGAWGGGYAYDPRGLPFVNRFVVAGDPTALLRPFLDGLIGQTGLDPLDVVQPLARYEFLRVWFPRQYIGVVQVTTRLTYTDNSQRTYDIPLYQPNHISGFYRSDWRYDGLGRLRTEHREIPGTPFAMATAPVRLGQPQRLPLHPQAQRLDAGNPANWGPYGIAWQYLTWSPQGDTFLVVQTVAYDRRDLWQVKLDGSPPVRIAQNVGDYDWSPDGKYIIFTQPRPEVIQPGLRQVKVFVVRRDSREQRELVRLESQVSPGLNDEGVWYPSEGTLWLAPYDRSPPHWIAPLPEAEATPRISPWGAGALVRPAPDGMRIAYKCGAGLCLQDRDGRGWTKVEVAAHDWTWSPDGLRLAAVQWDYGETPAVLALVRRDGQVERQVTLAPNGPAAAPQWTPDGSRLFVQTFPFYGRRILMVEAATGKVLDLSQPRWDAWFALAPDGARLLLSNGRGGFWLSELVFPSAEDSDSQG